MTRAEYAIFLVAPPGLEPWVAEEARELADCKVQQVPGGVRLRGSLVDAAGLATWSRTASRVLVELGEIAAPSAQALAVSARALPWSHFAVPGQRIQATATTRKSRISRPAVAAAKVEQAAREALRGPRRSARRPPPPLAVQVRVRGREATVSVDAGGGLLHKRGYRKATAKAPLRETLAATLLRAAGWSGDEPLVDPMCGSGTFAIEAAWMAQDRAPGRDRKPPAVSWPAFPDKLWPRLAQEARGPLQPVAVPLLGRDRDPGAIKAARQNAERAGVSRVVQFAHGELAEPWALLEGCPPGLVLLNPPYGHRVADKSRIKGLYASLGTSLRSRFPGWRLGLIATRPDLASRLCRGLDEVSTFKNGGIDVGFYVGEIAG